MKKILILTTALLSISIQANQIENITKNTTYIKTPKGSGTGFFIKDTNLMITNKHVVNVKSEFISVINSEGKKFFGQFVFSSLDYDLSLVKIFNETDTLKNNNTDLRINGGLTLCNNSNSNINDEILGVGSPAGQRHVFRKGYINSKNSYNNHFKQEVVQYQEYTGKGTSGSAIIHKEKDCVIGVNFAGMLEYDMGLAVPVENLKTFLNEYDLYSKLSKKGKLLFQLEELKNKEEKSFNDFMKKYLKEIDKRTKSIDNKKLNINRIIIEIKQDK
jgi:S1-C subfamily serine protease